MYIRDIVISAKESEANFRQFNFETTFLESLYLRGLGKVYTKKTDKIIIELGFEKLDKNTHSRSGSVALIEINFNFEAYWKENATERKKMALNCLHKGATLLAESNKWEVSKFQEAYNQCLKLKLQNKWYWKKRLFSPNKKFKTELLCTFNMTEFQCLATIRDSDDKEKVKKVIIKTKPHEIYFVHFLGKAKWLNNQIIVFQDKNGVEYDRIELQKTS